MQSWTLPFQNEIVLVRIKSYKKDKNGESFTEILHILNNVSLLSKIFSEWLQYSLTKPYCSWEIQMIIIFTQVEIFGEYWFL